MTNLYFDLCASEQEAIKGAEVATGGILSGRFGLKHVAGWYNLLDLSDYDKAFVRDVPVRKDEIIQRYVTLTTLASSCFPLIKINLERRLVYFLTQSAFDEGYAEFESRGEKACWMLLGDDRRVAV